MLSYHLIQKMKRSLFHETKQAVAILKRKNICGTKAASFF